MKQNTHLRKLLACVTGATLLASLGGIPALALPTDTESTPTATDPIGNSASADSTLEADDLPASPTASNPTTSSQPLASHPSSHAPVRARATSAAAEDPDPKYSHRPGIASDPDGKIVPEDLMVAADSPWARPGEAPNASNQVHHICAGKKLLYRAHVDAVYTTYINGELRVSVVDGSAVLEDPESVCLRLGPDADGNGQEVSRMYVPNNTQYSFLGKPGAIVWNAPVQNYGWAPIWAGYGAFDPVHEWSIPENYYNNVVLQWMETISAPGFVEVWTPPSVGRRATHLFSTQGYANEKLEQNIGGHGHLNWSFSKAGVYRLKFATSYVDKNTSETVTSRPTEQVWLVGSDEQVGLPENFTKNAPILVTTEKQREIAGLSAPSEETEGSSSTQTKQKVLPREISDEELQRSTDDAWWGPSDVPRTFISDGMFRLGANFLEPTELSVEYLLNDNAVSSRPIALEIPDSELRCVPKNSHTQNIYKDTQGGWLWMTSAKKTDGKVTFGWDTSKVDYSNIDQHISLLELTTSNSPALSRVIIADWKGSGNNLKPEIKLDTINRPNNRIDISEPSTGSTTLAFTHPGFYKLSLMYNTQFKEPVGPDRYRGAYAFPSLTVLVGNKAINYVRTKAWERDRDQATDGQVPPKPKLLPIGEYPTCSEAQLEGEDTDTETGGGSPAPIPPGFAMPVTSASEAAAVAKAVLSDQTRTLIRVGHIDHGIVFTENNARATAVAKWDHLNDKRSFASNTFVYAVPSYFHVDEVDSSLVGEELPSLFPDGLYFLPQNIINNDPDVPWTGFSTEITDFSKLTSSLGVTVGLNNFQGPGRMIIGTQNLNKFNKWLDSEEPDLTHKFSEGVHAHPATYFSKPGTYTADLTFSYVNSRLAPNTETLKVYWVVSDEMVKAAEQYTEEISNSSIAPDPAPTIPSGNLGITQDNKLVAKVAESSEVTLIATNMLPKREVIFELHSTPVELGRAVANEQGTATLVTTLPPNSAGQHTVWAKQEGNSKILKQPLTITAANDEPKLKDNTNEVGSSGVIPLPGLLPGLIDLSLGTGIENIPSETAGNSAENSKPAVKDSNVDKLVEVEDLDLVVAELNNTSNSAEKIRNTLKGTINNSASYAKQAAHTTTENSQFTTKDSAATEATAADVVSADFNARIKGGNLAKDESNKATTDTDAPDSSKTDDSLESKKDALSTSDLDNPSEDSSSTKILSAASAPIAVAPSSTGIAWEWISLVIAALILGSVLGYSLSTIRRK